MLSFLLIIVLILVVIYLYYQWRQEQPKSTFPRPTFARSDLNWAEPKNNDWENQTASVITSLEQEIQSITEVLNKTENEVQDLTTERDEAIRNQKEAEQEALSLANKLKNKAQEAEAKTKQIELLKKEKSEAEIRLNKSLTELKEKYCKQGKLLDEEQLECKKLEDNNLLLSQKIETLERTIQELKNPSPAPIYSRKTKKK